MIKKFIEQNKCISFFFLISFIINVVYIISYNWNEIFPHAGLIFDLIQQVSIGCIVSCVFYYIQVFLPYYQRRKKVNPKIKRKISSFIQVYRELIECICEMYVDNYDRGTLEHCKQQLDKINVIDLNDTIKRPLVHLGGDTELKYVKLYQKFRLSKSSAEKIMNELMLWYGNDITEEIVFEMDYINESNLIIILQVAINNIAKSCGRIKIDKETYEHFVDQLIALQKMYREEYS